MEFYLNAFLGCLLLGVHHFTRRIFYRLPLHTGTGFFVSNDTILNRRLNLRKSWNARFSGGNNILPEIFFSTVYLLTGRDKYAYYSRLLYTIVSILLYPALAIICIQLELGLVATWVALFLLALVLAEPQFGSYFESSEQFELIFLLWGFAAILTGFNTDSNLLIGAGLGLWLLSVVLIKFSFIVTPVIFSIQLFQRGESWTAIILPWIVGIAASLAWFAVLKSNPVQAIIGLFRHHLLGGHRLFSKQGFLLFYTKFQQALDVFGQNLPILLIAAYGFFFASTEAADSNIHYVLVLTMSTLISFFLQGSPSSSHTLPLVPSLVILGAFGASLLFDAPFTFWTGFSMLGLVCYYVIFFLRPSFMDKPEFFEWVWSSRPRNVPMAEVSKDRCFLADTARIKSKTFDFSVCLAGPHTQLYLLLGAAYPTPLLCAASWLDDLEPQWQREMVEQFRVYPAPYILDTSECFSMPDAARWGFNYELLDERPGVWRLYGHKPSKGWKGQEGDPVIFKFGA